MSAMQWWIIVPLHPDMCGEIAECKVASATVEGPNAQVLKHGQERRLVVALPESAMLIFTRVAHHRCRMDIHCATKGWEK